MKHTKIYLAGPMTGLSYKESNAWREYFDKNIDTTQIKCLSPFRGKSYLSDEPILKPEYNDYALSTGKGITTRDRWDAQRCDLLVVNFLGATTVSIGTVLEIAWADSKRIPIVIIMEEKGNPHEHRMITECAGFRVTTLDDAINIIHSILL